VPCSVSVCSNVPNFEQPKCFINTSPQRLVLDKMQYLETIADAAFEILKEKFQYVFDQLEPENKQYQAVSLTVELIKRASISSEVLVISCLYSGIALLDSVLGDNIFSGRILLTVRFNSLFVFWQNLLSTVFFCIKLLFISEWTLAVELL